MTNYISYQCGGLDRTSVTKFVDFNEGKLAGGIRRRAKQWPRLVEAIEKCQEAGAALIIAKIGRLARNARFLGLLMESGVDFACLDNEQCNKFTVAYPGGHGGRGVAKISERTKGPWPRP